MATIKPLLDKVLLKPEKSESSTRTGIILAGKSKDEPVIAQVIAKGPGGMVDGKEIKMYVHQGDKVIVNKYAGSEVTVAGEKYIIVSQSDVLAVIV
jgi:chaperonin GroES